MPNPDLEKYITSNEIRNLFPKDHKACPDYGLILSAIKDKHGDNALFDLLDSNENSVKDFALSLLDPNPNNVNRVFPSFVNQGFNQKIIQVFLEKKISSYAPLFVHRCIIELMSQLQTLPPYVEPLIRELVIALEQETNDLDIVEDEDENSYEEAQRELAFRTAMLVGKETLDIYLDFCEIVLAQDELSASYPVAFLETLLERKKFKNVIKDKFKNYRNILAPYFNQSVLDDLFETKSMNNIPKIKIKSPRTLQPFQFTEDNLDVVFAIYESAEGDTKIQDTLQAFKEVLSCNDQNAPILLPKNPHKIEKLYAIVKYIFLDKNKVKNEDSIEMVYPLIYALKLTIDDNKDDDDDDEADYNHVKKQNLDILLNHRSKKNRPHPSDASCIIEPNPQNKKLRTTASATTVPMNLIWNNTSNNNAQNLCHKGEGRFLAALAQALNKTPSAGPVPTLLRNLLLDGMETYDSFELEATMICTQFDINIHLIISNVSPLQHLLMTPNNNEFKISRFADPLINQQNTIHLVTDQDRSYFSVETSNVYSLRLK